MTCTYTNTKRGSITVEKVTDPASDTQTFAFTGDLAGSIGHGEHHHEVASLRAATRRPRRSRTAGT